MESLSLAGFNVQKRGHAEHGVQRRRGPSAVRHCGPAVRMDASKCRPAQQARPAEAQNASALAYRRSERTALFIQTQEGDTVRLTIKTRDAVALATSQADTDDEPLTELELRARSTTKIAFFVDGDLSADELAAIRGVVEQAAALAQEFFAGDFRSAFAAAAQLQVDATQLAKVGLKMSIREQLTYTQYGATRRPVPVPAAVGSTPAPAQPSAAPAGAPTAPIGSSSPTAADAVEPAAEPPQVPAAQSEPMPTPAGQDLQPANLTQAVLATIADFLSQLLETFESPVSEQDGEAPTASIGLSLKLKVFASVLLTMAASEAANLGTSDDLPALVPETLDALASQLQPPLDDLA
jgi:hypothetical protein